MTHQFPLTCQSGFKIYDDGGNIVYPHPTDPDYFLELNFDNFEWGELIFKDNSENSDYPGLSGTNFVTKTY